MTGRFDARRGPAGRPDATIRTDPDTMIALLFHGRALTEALRARDVQIGGSEQTAARLVRLLANPRPGYNN